MILEPGDRTQLIELEGILLRQGVFKNIFEKKKNKQKKRLDKTCYTGEK